MTDAHSWCQINTKKSNQKNFGSKMVGQKISTKKFFRSSLNLYKAKMHSSGPVAGQEAKKNKQFQQLKNYKPDEVFIDADIHEYKR